MLFARKRNLNDNGPKRRHFDLCTYRSACDENPGCEESSSGGFIKPVTFRFSFIGQEVFMFIEIEHLKIVKFGRLSAKIIPTGVLVRRGFAHLIDTLTIAVWNQILRITVFKSVLVNLTTSGKTSSAAVKKEIRSG